MALLDNKFWEITLAGRTVAVRFGRIGTEGQTQKKSFGNESEAKKQHDKLVAEKLKKGYRLAGAKQANSIKSETKSPAQRVSRGTVHATCAAIESYFDALRREGVELQDQVVKPQSETAIDAIEKKLSIRLSTDIKEYLVRGLRAATGSVDDGERFAAIGFDWLDAKKIVESTMMMRKAANDTMDDEDDEDDEHAQIIHGGVALTWSEPQIVVADAVYHFSFRNPVLRVASTFAEFLECWLASGCFGSHDFDLLWRRVKQHVPIDRAPAQNPWVKAYKKQFPGLSKG